MTENQIIECEILVVPCTERERQEFIEDLGYDRGIWFNYFIRYSDESFVDHVEAHLPKRDPRSAIRAGKNFHACGIGFESEEKAIENAHLNNMDLLDRLSKVGHPWKPSPKVI